MSMYGANNNTIGVNKDVLIPSKYTIYLADIYYLISFGFKVCSQCRI